jgi:hypothetical protein
MSDEAVAKVVDGRAWLEFCELLRKAGDVIAREDLGTTPFDRAEGLRYLSRLLAAGFSSFVEATGPAHPVFRPLPELVKMGLDNPDNYYVSASIDPRRDYRIRGTRGTIHYLSFAAQNQNFAARDKITGGAGHLNDSELALSERRQLRDHRESARAFGKLAAARARHQADPRASDLPRARARAPGRARDRVRGRRGPAARARSRRASADSCSDRRCTRSAARSGSPTGWSASVPGRP